MSFKYAVLWELTGTSQPVGIVVQREGYVLVELPSGYGMPKRYEAPYRVLQPDMSEIVYRPSDEVYFDQVLHDLSRHFAVCQQGVIERADDGEILGLLHEHVLAPRTQRHRADYNAGLLAYRPNLPARLGRVGELRTRYNRRPPVVSPPSIQRAGSLAA